MANYGRRRFLRALASVAVPLAAGAIAAARLGAQEPLYRSPGDQTPRLPDLLDRPPTPERQTHRGFEVRTPQFIVVAMTSMDDARWGAGKLEQAWSDIGQLADHWTAVHHRADFGIGALQLVINNEPIRDLDEPPVTVNVVGIQTQIQLNVGNGLPPLEDQLPRLREAAAWAFLHTAEFDRQLPRWVCHGLAAHVGAQDQSLGTTVPDPAPGGEPIGGDQWRYDRKSPDQLNVPPSARDQDALAVRYFLLADDAAHVPTFFAAIRQTVAEARGFWAEEPRMRTRQVVDQLSEAERSLQQLTAASRSSYSEWLKNPQRGQPIVDLPANATPVFTTAGREMAVVLKLARRFATASSTIQTKVVSFDAERRVATTSSPQQFRSIAELYRHLSATNQPWATLDASGQLVFSHDQQAVRDLLGLDDRRYEFQSLEGRWVLTQRLDARTTLCGWLEENPDDVTRPLARFKLVDDTQH